MAFALLGHEGPGFAAAAQPSITVMFPADGAVIARDQVIVRGTVRGVTPDIGVVVNGRLAHANNGVWGAELRLFAGANDIVVTATDADGAAASAALQVRVPKTLVDWIGLKPSWRWGEPPYEVTWQAENTFGKRLVLFEFDETGSGTFGPPLAAFDGTKTTYRNPGLVFPVLRATDAQGKTYTATTLVNVGDSAALERVLQGRWSAFKAALTAGDAKAALGHIFESARHRYTDLFNAFGPRLSTLGTGMPAIMPVYFTEDVAKYRLRRDQEVGGRPQTITHYVYFSRDADGLWRIDSF